MSSNLYIYIYIYGLQKVGTLVQLTGVA